MAPPRHRPTLLLLVVLLVLGATASLPAPGRATGRALPPFGEVVEVQVVELALLAADRQGRPVPDLTAAEVVVYEDGLRVPIDKLTRLDAGGSTDAGAAAGSADPPIHIAILLDEVHVGAETRRLLLGELTEVLRQHLRPADPVMVALYEGITRVVLPFTTDRQALAAALQSVETVSPARLIVERERLATLESLALDASGQHGWSPCLHIAELVESYGGREYRRVQAAAEALGAFADGLAGIRGRKVLFHVSDGIPLRAGQEAADLAMRLCSGVAAAQGEAGAGDLTGTEDIFGPEHRSFDGGRYDTTRFWEDAAARASAGEVTVYSIQAGRGSESRLPGAEVEAGRGNLATPAAHSDNLQDTLYLLADQTGGRALLGGGDLRSELGGAIDQLRTAYLLTYSPPPGGSVIRRLRVEVTRPGVSVRHRKLYRQRPLQEQIAGQLLARLLYGDADRNQTPSLELIGRTAATAGAVRARFRLRVPLARLSLVDGGELRQGAFAVLLAVADDQGRSSSVRRTLVPVQVSKTEPPPTGDFVWEVEILMRPGKQRVGLALRDEVGGELSFLVRDFDVPSFGR